MGPGTGETSSADSAAATVTRLLSRAGAGDPEAAAMLLPLVYQQLRRLARQKMRHEPMDQTLQATALVHEAYLRLVDFNPDALPRQWDGRWHFLAAAAEAMRRILVEQARRRGRLKRGGDRQRIALNSLELTMHEPPEQMIELNEALDELTAQQPRKAQLVKLRYFAGLTIDEAAQALDISTATAERHWAYARAWLFRRIHSQAE